MNEYLKNKWIYVVAFAVVIVLAVMWIYPSIQGNDAQGGMQADMQTQTDNTVLESSDSKNGAVPEENEGYYVVQENNGKVNVYQYVNGEKVFCKETSVAFELLGSEDQQLLKTGVQLKDEQELANFLENFVS